MATKLRRPPPVPQRRCRGALARAHGRGLFLPLTGGRGDGRPGARRADPPPRRSGEGRRYVCLDGSPPDYHLQRGFGSGSRSWLVYLQGGAWCNSAESCSERKMTALGSSKFMEPVEFDGMLSNQHQLNPGRNV
ncbi:hypothetical protein SEVIR_5G416000v4 [Setaria viridis]